jgi:hypothetical protein
MLIYKIVTDFKNIIPILSIFLSCSLIQGQSVVTKENYDKLPKDLEKVKNYFQHIFFQPKEDQSSFSYFILYT